MLCTDVTKKNKTRQHHQCDANNNKEQALLQPTFEDMLEMLRSINQDNPPKERNRQRKEIPKMLKGSMQMSQGIATILQHLGHVSQKRISLDGLVFEVGSGTSEECPVGVFDDRTEEEAHGR